MTTAGADVRSRPAPLVLDPWSGVAVTRANLSDAEQAQLARARAGDDYAVVPSRQRIIILCLA